MSERSTHEIAFRTTADTGGAEKLTRANEQAATSAAKLATAAGQSEGALAASGGAQEQSAKGARNNSVALLQASQAFEDMQYGIRGVLNNIPGLVQSLGMGAGLAGGISIAAVAATSLLPKLSDWLGITQALDNALGGTAAKLREDAVTAGAAYEQSLDKSGAQSRLFEASLKEQSRALDENNAALNRNLSLLQARQQISVMLEDAQLASEIQDIEAAGLPAQEKASQIAQAKLRSQDRKAAGAEQTRAAELTTAQTAERNNLLALQSATAQRQQFEGRQNDATLAQSLQAEQGILQNDLNKLTAERGRIASEFGDDAARAATPELEQKQQDAARKESQLAGIMARYGGQLPAALPQDQFTSQRDALRGREGSLSESLISSNTARKDLEQRQQAEREAEAARRAMETQNIARGFTTAAFPGLPVFNDPARGAATGKPFAPAMLPMPSAMPTGGSSEAPANIPGALSQAVDKTASPLENTALPAALDTLGKNILGRMTQLEQADQANAALITKLAAQIANGRS
jgi:hypothetical protein